MWIRLLGRVGFVRGKIKRGDDNIARISSGWGEFASRAGLKVGDVCAVLMLGFGGGISVEVKTIRTANHTKCQHSH